MKMSDTYEDDVETNLARIGIVAGVGLPILVAPVSESFGAAGGIAIVGAISAVWILLFVKLLQKVGL